MKSGTGELMRQLNQHSLIESDRGYDNMKEIHYFRDYSYFPNKIYIHLFYLQYFPLKTLIKHNNIQYFDKSPDYMRSKLKLYEISLLLPNIKLIIILKNPIFRAISGFNHNCLHKYYFYDNDIIHFHTNSKVRRKPIEICNNNTFEKYYFYSNNNNNNINKNLIINNITINKYAYDEISYGFYDTQIQNVIDL